MLELHVEDRVGEGGFAVGIRERRWRWLVGPAEAGQKVNKAREEENADDAGGDFAPVNGGGGGGGSKPLFGLFPFCRRACFPGGAVSEKWRVRSARWKAGS
ncbi:MAG: hypothetical protein LC775_13585 [Acidobacteria bacterium]|nr:hypothetical protein [Acidobacteriota bacterium]